MRRRTWAMLLAIYGLAGFTLSVFTGTQVAPCLAGPAPDIQAACVAHWFANRGLMDRLVDTPIPGTVLFVALVAVTILLTRRRTSSSGA